MDEVVKDLSDTFLIEEQYSNIMSADKQKGKAYSEIDIKHLKSVDQISALNRGPRAHKQVGRQMEQKYSRNSTLLSPDSSSSSPRSEKSEKEDLSSSSSSNEVGDNSNEVEVTINSSKLL